MSLQFWSRNLTFPGLEPEIDWRKVIYCKNNNFMWAPVKKDLKFIISLSEKKNTFKKISFNYYCMWKWKQSDFINDMWRSWENNKIMIDVIIDFDSLFLFQGLNIIFHVALALLKVSPFLCLTKLPYLSALGTEHHSVYNLWLILDSWTPKTTSLRNSALLSSHLLLLCILSLIFL